MQSMLILRCMHVVFAIVCFIFAIYILLIISTRYYQKHVYFGLLLDFNQFNTYWGVK